MKSYINSCGFFSTYFRIGDKFVSTWVNGEEKKVLEKGKVHVCRILRKCDVKQRKDMSVTDQDAYFVRSKYLENDELRNDNSIWKEHFVDYKGDDMKQVWEEAYKYVKTGAYLGDRSSDGGTEAV